MVRTRKPRMIITHPFLWVTDPVFAILDAQTWLSNRNVCPYRLGNCVAAAIPVPPSPAFLVQDCWFLCLAPYLLTRLCSLNYSLPRDI